MKTKIARREFLRQAGKSVGAAAVGSVVFDSVIGHLMSRAFAQTMGASNAQQPFSYVHLTFPGGPPRWFFDALLTPNGKTANNFRPGGFGTTLSSNNGLIGADYNVEAITSAGKTLHLPPVWKMNVGGQNFADLLKHTLFIRGMDMEINSHPLSNQRQVAPVIGYAGLTGVTSDASPRPIPAIVDPGSEAARQFKSRRGFAAIPINYSERGTNPVVSLLKPFEDYRNGRKNLHGADRAALQAQALSYFESYASAHGLTASALPKMYENAIDLLDSNITKLGDKWASTVAKYRNLIDAALAKSGSLPAQINARNLQASAGNNARLSYNTGAFVSVAHAHDMIGATTMAPNMAENFAVAEILLDTVSSSFTLGFGGLSNLRATSSMTFGCTHDQHQVGSIVSTVATTLFYRALLACLTEFVSELKARGVFDRTLIHLAAEWSRTPRRDGTGSDHGVGAGNTTLISGLFQKPAVIGNVLIPDASPTYVGTFGRAANYSLSGANRPIQVNDVAATITAMLGGMESVVTNGRLLTKFRNGVWVPAKEEAQNRAS